LRPVPTVWDITLLLETKENLPTNIQCMPIHFLYVVAYVTAQCVNPIMFYSRVAPKTVERTTTRAQANGTTEKGAGASWPAAPEEAAAVELELDVAV